MIHSLPFQDLAVKRLVAQIGLRVRQRDSSSTADVVLLQAPTGSGKTVIAGLAMRELDAIDDVDVAFLWIAPYSLHEQAGRSLNNIVGSAQKVTDGDELGPRRLLDRGEVVFLNWASINSSGNRLRTGAEMRASLSEISEATRAAGRQIILVIDESHHSRATANAEQVIAEIRSDVIVEMSATPDVAIGGAKHVVEVDRDEVCDAGVIRTCIMVNDDLDRFATPESAGGGLITDDELLQAALDKRAGLAAEYQRQGIAINPLLLIQLPDGRAGDAARRHVEGYLSRERITEENGRLAVWLSEHKTLDPADPRILADDGDVDVLIFKQAIATGWDCPRAQVLYKLRDPSKQEKFEIQTLGRIMRMPKRVHYDDPTLNRGYVYHGHVDYKPAENMAIVSAVAYLKPGFDWPEVTCQAIGRTAQLRLTSDEIERIADHFTTEGLGLVDRAGAAANRECLDGWDFNLDISSSLISDLQLDGEGAQFTGGGRQLRRQLSNQEIQRTFEAFVTRVLGPAENPGALRDAIYDRLELLLDLRSERDCQAFILANVDEVERHGSRHRERHSARQTC